MLDKKLRELILGRYRQQGKINEIGDFLYTLVLVVFLLSSISLLSKGIIVLLLVINIARQVLDNKIRKNVHIATVKEYSWSIGMSIVELMLFMLWIAFLKFKLLGLVIAIILAFMINFEVRVLLEFRRLAKERDINQKGNVF